MTERWIRLSYGATLVSLPWVGVGVLRLITGRDLGAGFQPAWILLALGVCFFLRRQGNSLPGMLVVGKSSPAWIWLVWLEAVLLVVGVSVVGLSLAPSGVGESTAGLRWLKQAIQLGIMLAFVVWPAVWTRGTVRWQFTLRWLTVGALLQLAYSGLQAWDYYRPFGLLAFLEPIFTSNPAILSGSGELYLGNTFLPIPRLRGTVCEPLFLGNYLVFLLPWLLCTPHGDRRRLTGLAVLLLLLLTWARGAWLAALFQLALWLVWRFIRSRLADSSLTEDSPSRRVWWGALALGAVLVLALGLEAGWDRLLLPWERLVQSFSRQDWSTLTRLYSMQAAWRAFLISPLVGVGWGQFAFHFPLLVDPMGLHSQFSWPVVNNLPLQILCETGVLGGGILLAFLAWLGTRVWTGLRTAPPGSARQSRILAGALSVCGVWVQLLTFSQYNLAHIWLALGLLIAALVDVQSEETP